MRNQDTAEKSRTISRASLSLLPHRALKSPGPDDHRRANIRRHRVRARTVFHRTNGELNREEQFQEQVHLAGRISRLRGSLTEWKLWSSRSDAARNDVPVSAVRSRLSSTPQRTGLIVSTFTTTRTNVFWHGFRVSVTWNWGPATKRGGHARGRTWISPPASFDVPGRSEVRGTAILRDRASSQVAL